ATVARRVGNGPYLTPRETGGEPLDSSRFGTLWKDDRMKLLLRILVAAAALGVATWLVPGIELRAGSTTSKVLTLIVVALIVGVVNAVLKPIVKTIGCLFYVLT